MTVEGKEHSRSYLFYYVIVCDGVRAWPSEAGRPRIFHQSLNFIRTCQCQAKDKIRSLLEDAGDGVGLGVVKPLLLILTDLLFDPIRYHHPELCMQHEGRIQQKILIKGVIGLMGSEGSPYCFGRSFATKTLV